MVLQKKYLSQPAAIASYNLTDLTTGRGILTFYAGEVVSGAAVAGDLSGTCLLSVNPFYSHAVIKYKYMPAGAIGSNTPEIRFPYDAYFNVPAIVEGQTITNITCGWACSTATTIQLRPTISFYKIDNGTEIFRCSGAGFLSGAGLGTTTAQSFTTAVLCNFPNTHFKTGDTLRVYVDIWGSYTGAANAVGFGYAQDPMDRNDASSGTYYPIIEDADTTQLKVFIPFIPDL